MLEKLGGANFSGPMIIPSISILFPSSMSDSRNLVSLEKWLISPLVQRMLWCSWDIIDVLSSPDVLESWEYLKTNVAIKKDMDPV